MAAKVLTDDDLDPLRRELAELRAGLVLVARWAGVPEDELAAVMTLPVKPAPVHRPGWLAAKKAALGRALAKCEDCGSGRALHVHHVLPRADGGDDDLRNLRVLCANCHDEAHRKTGEAKE